MEICDRDFSEKVLNSTKPVLVEYWASWCPPCHTIKQILNKLGNEDTGYQIITINVDRNLVNASKYDVKGVPYFMIFKQGELVYRDVGVKSEKQLRGILMENL